MEDKKSFLLCLLLAIAGIVAAENLNRVKRASPPPGGEPNNLANQIRRNSGFDTKDLPEDLMQAAADLFMMVKEANASSPVMMILQSVQGDMRGNVSMTKIKKSFVDILTNVEFITEFKALKATHAANPESAEFKAAAKELIMKYMKTSSAAGLTASVAVVLLAVVVHFVDFL